MNKLMLVILDGVGLREEKNGNAFLNANKPNFDMLWNKYPHSTLNASETYVGLPEGQMGNSETGHLNIGAGRIVYQPLELINKSIKDDSFYSNDKILDVINYAIENNKKLHILGLISDGGIHSHINHLKAILKLCKDKNISPYMHLITDGRDTKVDSGYSYVSEIENLNIGKVSSLCGRFYTMDRDKNYDRLEKGYNLITKGIGKEFNTTKEAFDYNYRNNIYDEFIEPSIIDKNGLIDKDDAIIWFNYRPDRAIQILSYLQKDTSHIVTMMKVSDDIKVPYAFSNTKLDDLFGDVISNNNLRQLRIAETEKYAHVTYFFDGGVNKEIPLCDRILINSPKVKTYDLKPEMSAYEVTDKLLEVISNYDVIILNYANCDMVGHTGNYDAAVSAVESVDKSLGKVYEACLNNDITLVVCADHGNVETMIDNGDVCTTHTTNKVPFIVCKDNINLNNGSLCDIAPTMLDLIGIKKPNLMTGKSLVINNN